MLRVWRQFWEPLYIFNVFFSFKISVIPFLSAAVLKFDMENNIIPIIICLNQTHKENNPIKLGTNFIQTLFKTFLLLSLSFDKSPLYLSLSLSLSHSLTHTFSSSLSP